MNDIIKKIVKTIFRLDIEIMQPDVDKIKLHHNKNALMSAFLILKSFDFPSELIKIFTNSILHDQWTISPHHPVVLDQLRILLNKIVNIKNDSLIEAFATLSQLLGKSNLSLSDSIKLMELMFTHQYTGSLNSALKCIRHCVFIDTLYPKHMMIVLNAVLQDQKTPVETAYILNLLIGEDANISIETLQNYAQRAAATHPKKTCFYITAKAVEMIENWSPERIKRCLRTVLGSSYVVVPAKAGIHALEHRHTTTEMDPRLRGDGNVLGDDIHRDVQEFLTLFDAINSMYNAMIYHVLAPLTNPDTYREFLRMTSILRGNGGIKWTRVPFTTTGYLSQILSNISFDNTIDKLIESSPPSISPFKQRLSESNGYTEYCHCILRTSHRFFNRPKALVNDERPESEFVFANEMKQSSSDFQL